jgi:hypothetical protein
MDAVFPRVVAASCPLGIMVPGGSSSLRVTQGVRHQVHSYTHTFDLYTRLVVKNER